MAYLFHVKRRICGFLPVSLNGFHVKPATINQTVWRFDVDSFTIRAAKKSGR